MAIKKDVKFNSSISGDEHCVCSACFGTGRVTKLLLPDTRYHNCKDLETRYVHYWVCEECRRKLFAAVDFDGRLSLASTDDYEPITRFFQD